MKHKLRFSHVNMEANCAYYDCEKCGVVRAIDLDHPETINWIVDKDDCEPICEEYHHVWKYDGFTGSSTNAYFTLRCIRCSRRVRIEIGRLIKSEYAKIL